VIQGKGGNKAGAALVGEFIAKRAAGKGIRRVVFDRNGFLYHGRVKTLAESARQHGLEF
jgi:large subunit ribosomal protein L18